MQCYSSLKEDLSEKHELSIYFLLIKNIFFMLALLSKEDIFFDRHLWSIFQSSTHILQTTIFYIFKGEKFPNFSCKKMITRKWSRCCNCLVETLNMYSRFFRRCTACTWRVLLSLRLVSHFYLYSSYPKEAKQLLNGCWLTPPSKCRQNKAQLFTEGSPDVKRNQNTCLI